MTETYNETVTLVKMTCINCGIFFGVPFEWDRRRRDDHNDFFCPNGHSQRYSGKSEAEKLRDQLAQQKSNAEFLEARLKSAREHAEATDRRLSAAKGTITKIKNRVGNGVCPCCNRTFRELERHMATQHPEFKKA